MKKKFTLTMAIMAIAFSYGQYNVPVPNGDMESSTAMTTVDNKRYSIDGFDILENEPGGADTFNESLSGLAPGEGQGASQALKSVTQNTVGSTSHVVLLSQKIDISGYGPGDYTFSFYLKTANAPASGKPFWVVAAASDEDLANVTGATVTPINNGGSLIIGGSNSNQWAELANDYQLISISITLSDNNSGGKDAKYLDLRVQHGKEDNTYWFDNVSLSSSSPLSIKSFEKIGVSMYPNPVSSISYIKSITPIENVSLYSLTGKLLLNKKVGVTNYNLDVSSYSKGLYLLTVTNSKGTSTSKLIVD